MSGFGAGCLGRGVYFSFYLFPEPLEFSFIQPLSRPSAFLFLLASWPLLQEAGAPWWVSHGDLLLPGVTPVFLYNGH